MITIRDAVIGYGTTRFVTAVNGVNLTIGDDEIIGIAGESGSGKSTLIRAIYGDFSNGMRMQSGTISAQLTEPASGRIVQVDAKGMRQLWWDLVSYVPQGSMSVLNPLMRIEKQLLDGLPGRVRQGSRDELRARLVAFLAGLGLDASVLKAFPHQLSGGMRQRVLVAIAAFVDPRLILADEPTTALDVVVQKRILIILTEIQRRLRNTLVLVSHDLGVHYQITDRIAIMYQGQIVEVGPTRQVFANPQHEYTRNLIGSLPQLQRRHQSHLAAVAQ
jgi:peptide/nickel transport system ATP-binding protein